MTRWKNGKLKNGELLEKNIILANDKYKKQRKALIDKVPTNWSVRYKKEKWTNKAISSAYPKAKTIVDFVGVSQGRSIAFDAKSTTNRTRFDLKNIQKHQVEYLTMHKEQGGISFFIVEFVKHQEVYYLEIDQLQKWWSNWDNGGRASIPYQWFMLNTDQIKPGNGLLINYWNVLEKYIEKGEINRDKRNEKGY